MIEVPRDNFKKNNEGVTKDLEDFLNKFFNDEENDGQPWHLDDLKIEADNELGDKYPDVDFVSKDSCYVGYALNILCFNRYIKKVAPNTYENVAGPDPELERITGYAPEGKLARRSYNVYEREKPGYMRQWNADLNKVQLSIKMLRELGKTNQEILYELGNERFNQTALRLEIKKSSK
jgi:hypothetical protein